MGEVLRSERVAALVEQANDALQVRARLVERGQEIGEVDETIDSIYRDLGRAVHAALQPELHPTPRDDGAPAMELKGAIAEIDPLDIQETEGGDDDTEPTEMTSEGWYSEAVVSSGRFFDEGDLDDEGFRQVPMSDPDEEAESGDASFYDDPLEISMAELATSKTTEGESLWILHNSQPTWSERVTQMIEQVVAPPGTGLKEASIRVQRACSDVGIRLDGLPSQVQLVILGWLASRAQALREGLEDDIGQRLALDRLRRFRVEAGLPTLAALTASPMPETGKWTNDADGWLALLTVAADEE